MNPEPALAVQREERRLACSDKLNAAVARAGLNVHVLPLTGGAFLVWRGRDARYARTPADATRMYLEMTSVRGAVGTAGR